jgi:hypothetical protein
MTTLRALPCLIATCVFASALTMATAVQAASANTNTATGKTAKKPKASPPKTAKNPSQDRGTLTTRLAKRNWRLETECHRTHNMAACLGFGD